MPNAKRRAERDEHRDRWRSSAPGAWDSPALDSELPSEPTTLHAQRLDTVLRTLQDAGVRSVADLGCGDGALVRRLLAEPRIQRVVALDRDAARLTRLERSVDPAAGHSGRLVLLHGSFAARHAALAGVDAVAMVETIEHLAPTDLSAVEHQVFGVIRPALVVITTPNVECNGLLGVPPDRFREPGHHFEWPRSRFRTWAAGIASRRGYVLQIGGIGPADPWAGCPTQWARFEREARPSAPGESAA